MIRNLGNLQYDHVCLAIDSLLVFDMTFPIARVVSITKAIHPKYSPLVLRPKMDSIELANFLNAIKKLVGERYDIVELCKAIMHIGKVRVLKKQATLKDSIKSTTRLICTEVAFNALARTSKQFYKALETSYNKLDLASKGYVTPDDFLVL